MRPPKLYNNTQSIISVLTASGVKKLNSSSIITKKQLGNYITSYPMHLPTDLHSRKIHACTKCDRIFNTALQLDTHLALQDQKFICTRHGMQFNTDAIRIKHLQNYHASGHPQSTPLAQCFLSETCNESFAGKNALSKTKEHMLKKHLEPDGPVKYPVNNSSESFYDQQLSTTTQSTSTNGLTNF